MPNTWTGAVERDRGSGFPTPGVCLLISSFLCDVTCAFGLSSCMGASKVMAYGENEAGASVIKSRNLDCTETRYDVSTLVVNVC